MNRPGWNLGGAGDVGCNTDPGEDGGRGCNSDPGDEGGRGCSSLVSLLLLGVDLLLLIDGEEVIPEAKLLSERRLGVPVPALLGVDLVLWRPGEDILVYLKMFLKQLIT